MKDENRTKKKHSGCIRALDLIAPAATVIAEYTGEDALKPEWYEHRELLPLSEFDDVGQMLDMIAGIREKAGVRPMGSFDMLNMGFRRDSTVSVSAVMLLDVDLLESSSWMKRYYHGVTFHADVSGRRFKLVKMRTPVNMLV